MTAMAMAAGVRRTRPSFAGAARAEMLKLRSQTMLWVTAGLILGGSCLAIAALLASSNAKDLLHHDALAFYFNYLSGVQVLFGVGGGIFLLLLTARLVGMEYSSGTIRIVLGRGTPRLQLLLAQMLVMAVCGILLMAVFAAVFTTTLYVLVSAWAGSFDPIRNLPPVAWHDTWASIGATGISEAVCILLGAAAAVVGRSLAFAIGVAMGFFPADNFGSVVMLLLGRATKMDVWRNAQAWFLGPNLNILPQQLQLDHNVVAPFAPVLVHVDLTHTYVVILIYSLVFALLAAGLTWYRDVLE